MTLVDAETGEIVETLEGCEAIIERGLGVFIDVGNALIAIRDGRLYRREHDTFEAYCQARWNLSRKRAYDLTGAAEVVAALSPMGDIPLPRNERQARALAPLKDEPEHMADAMKRATADAKPATASGIRDAVKEIVREEVAKAAQRTEDREALADLARNAERAGLDLDEERQTQRGAFARLCRDLAAFPQPQKFLASQRDYLKPRHRAGAQAAHDWLTELLNEWGEA